MTYQGVGAAVRTFTAPGSGPVVFELGAAAARVKITVSLDAPVARAEVSGPTEVVRSTRASVTGGRWVLALPSAQAGTSVTRTSSRTTVIAGDIPAGVSVIGGQVIIGGRDVTAAVSAAAPEPVRVTVTLPAGSAVVAQLGAGLLTVCGGLAHGDITATSADVDAGTVNDVRVRTVSGDIAVGGVAGSAQLVTVSGEISVAIAAGPVTAQTTSGDITVHATQPVTVDATSVSGDITVTARPGIRPDVRARSVSGRVRTSLAGDRR